MTDSLRDQLLKLGFKKPEPPARPAAPAARPAAKTGAPHSGQHRHGPHSAAAPGHAGNAGVQQRPQQQPRPQQPRSQQPRPQQPRPPQQSRPQPSGQQAVPKPPRSQEEIDLARAYALRDRQEREERERSKREAEAKAKERRERRVLLRNLVQGKSLNDPEAELLRHFPHGDKIKRVHVNADQLQRLNAGDLGVVQMEGRYLLVERECALAVRAAVPEAVVLLPEPGEVSDDDWTLPPPVAPAAT